MQIAPAKLMFHSDEEASRCEFKSAVTRFKLSQSSVALKSQCVMKDGELFY